MSDNLSLGDMDTFAGSEVQNNSQLLFSGDELGEYRVIRLLGIGGMGQVFLVENIHMHKQYALKVLPPNLSKNKNFIDRFRIEARVMADLDHPNIAGVHNIGHDKERGLFYLVMEFIDSVVSSETSVAGEKPGPGIVDSGSGTVDLQTTVNEQQTTNPSDLEQLLKEKKKLPENYVLKITQQLCSALDYAHNFRGKGIIHRDLKPSNILLDAEGNAHIADFGLAKVVGSDYLKSMIDRSMRLTMIQTTDYRQQTVDLSLGNMNTMVPSSPSGYDATRGQTVDNRQETADSRPNQQSAISNQRSIGSAGSLIGTYEYMAPEQQEGLEATVQSDIYSLGLIIYRMLTGRKVKGKWKSPSDSGCSVNWDDIIDRCIEQEPEDRFNSVKDIIKLLNFNIIAVDVKKEHLKTQNSHKSKKGTALKIITLFILFCVIGVGGFYGYKHYQKNDSGEIISVNKTQINNKVKKVGKESVLSITIPKVLDKIKHSKPLESNKTVDKTTEAVVSKAAKPLKYKKAKWGNIAAIPLSKDINAGILVDVNTREVLWAKNCRKSLQIGSMTKMMTVLLAVEAVKNNPDLSLDTEIRVTKEAAKIGGSQVWLNLGESFSLKELLKTIMIKNANDSAYLVAQFLGNGDISAFVADMNKKAKEIKMCNAYFSNSDGISGMSNRATAEGLVFLAEQLTQYPLVIKWASTKIDWFREGTKDPTMLTNTNFLVRNGTNGVNGMMIGYTPDLGYCSTITCTRNGKTLIAVVNGVKSRKNRDDFAGKLLNWGYKKLDNVQNDLESETDSQKDQSKEDMLINKKIEPVKNIFNINVSENNIHVTVRTKLKNPNKSTCMKEARNLAREELESYKRTLKSSSVVSDKEIDDLWHDLTGNIEDLKKLTDGNYEFVFSVSKVEWVKVFNKIP